MYKYVSVIADGSLDTFRCQPGASLYDHLDAYQKTQCVLQSRLGFCFSENQIVATDIGTPHEKIGVFLPGYNFESGIGRGWDCTYRCLQSVYYAITQQLPPSIQSITADLIASGQITKERDWAEPLMVSRYLKERGLVDSQSQNMMLQIDENPERGTAFKTRHAYGDEDVWSVSLFEIEEVILTHFACHRLPIVLDDSFHTVVLFGVFNGLILVGDNQCLYQDDCLAYRPLEDVFKYRDYALFLPNGNSLAPLRDPKGEAL